MRLCLTLCAMALLAACGTPQEQCVRKHTREIRTIDTLIETVAGNLARGYAIRTESYTQPVWAICSVSKDANGAVIKQEYCWDYRTYTRNVPEPIDATAEQRKLDTLKSKRSALVRLAAPAVAQCKIDFPE